MLPLERLPQIYGAAASRDVGAAGDLEAIRFLKGTSPVAWRNVNLIGNFDFTTSSSPVDIEALAARYENEDFWRRSMQEEEDDGPESSVNAN